MPKAADVGDASQLARAAASSDPAVGLAAAAGLARLAEQLEAEHVRRARALGWSWQQIASALRVSRQAVHKKHAHLLESEGT